MKIKINDVINNRIVIELFKNCIRVKCLNCGKIAKIPKSKKLIETRYCNCQHSIGLRYSGLVYENSKEKLQAIKMKYAKGVNDKMINDWIMGL